MSVGVIAFALDSQGFKVSVLRAKKFIVSIILFRFTDTKHKRINASSATLEAESKNRMGRHTSPSSYSNTL